MTSETCAYCPHPLDPHRLIALQFVAYDGGPLPVAGFIICADPECDCKSTWCVEPYTRDDLDFDPDDFTLKQLRDIWARANAADGA